MNPMFVVIGADDLVEQAGLSPAPPPDAVIVDRARSVSGWSRCYVDGANGIVPRPSLPGPARTGDSFMLGPVPLATELRVYDLQTEELMHAGTAPAGDHVFNVSFLDTGRYRVELDPPLPFLDQVFEVMV